MTNHLKGTQDLTKGKLASIVSEQLPEFVQSDHATFVAFLEAYYEYVEQEQKAIESSRNIRLYNDIDRTIEDFVKYFKKEYLVDIPDNILADKRLLLKNIKDFYGGKGTNKSLILLFRLLFNEEVEVYYPKTDLLRVSDGNFNSETVINLYNVQGPTAEIVGGQLVQENNKDDPTINLAFALIENFLSFAVADRTIYQLVITRNSLSGTFVPGQTVTITTSNGVVTGIVDEIITDVNISNDGAYYTSGDGLVSTDLAPRLEKEDDTGYILTEDNQYISRESIGSGAQFDILSVGKGSIDKYLIRNGGSGYEVDDQLVYTETNLGTNANAKVSRVQPALLMENGSDFLLTETGTKTLIQETFDIVLEDGSNIILESGATLVNESFIRGGSVREIKIIDEGSNYSSLPIVSITSAIGTGADVLALSSSVGRITGIKRTNLGTGYFEPPVITTLYNMILTDIVGTLSVGERVSSQPYRVTLENQDYIKLESDDYLMTENDVVFSGTIISIDTARGLYKILPDPPGNEFVYPTEIRNNYRIIGQNGATAKISEADPAVIDPVVGTISRSEGTLFGADGRISESSKKIQDSFYYQEFSYVVKVGQSINIWRDAVKRILHPVGLALFGEVSISTTVSARAWGGSNVRLNGTQPRFKQIQQSINLLTQTLMTNHATMLEVEIFAEVANATLFPTRIMLEDGGHVLTEDSNTPYTNKGNNYLRGEQELVGTEPGATYPRLIFPSQQLPMANIDATIQFLKEVVLFIQNTYDEVYLREDYGPRIPQSPQNYTLGGNRPTDRFDATPDITVLIQTFDQYVNSLTANVSVRREIEIYKQIQNVASAVERIVTLYLPTITSEDTLKVLTSSKLYLIINSVLSDRYLTESFGSAKLGTTGYSIDRFKFLLPPYSSGTRSIDRGGKVYRDTYDSSDLIGEYTGTNTANDTYWDTYANTQIRHLNELVSIADLVTYPGRKTNFTFDSEIILRDT